MIATLAGRLTLNLNVQGHIILGLKHDSFKFLDKLVFFLKNKVC